MGWFLHLLQHVPVWAAGLILAAIGIAVSQLCLLVVGRLTDAERRRQSNELIALALSVTAVIYAVPLALIAGEAWSDFTEARAAAAREAGAVARTAQLASVLHPEAANAIRAVLADYAAAVIELEWPEMTQGAHPRAAAPLLTDLHRQIAAQAGRDVTDDANARLLRQLDDLGAARAGRILAVQEGLIGAIWWLIGVGGTITLMLCAVYACDDMAMQRVLCAIVSLGIMSVVLLIVATDRPFHGVPRVPPDAMRDILENELGRATR